MPGLLGERAVTRPAETTCGSALPLDVARQQGEIGRAETVSCVELVPEQIGLRLLTDRVEPLDIGTGEFQIGGGQVVDKPLFGPGAPTISDVTAGLAMV